MIEGLLDQLKNKELNHYDRFAAILALIRFYDQKCLPILKEVLEDSNDDPEIRSAVALGLGKLGEESLKELKKHLEDENPTIRKYVVHAIGMIGEKALPVLVKALDDRENEVFYSAADAIESIGEPAVPYLTRLLEEGREDVKCVAAWKLGELKDLRAVPALIKTVRDSGNNDDVLALSTWALGELARLDKNNKSIVAALYKATRSKNLEIKQRAIIALTKARDLVN